ncbi:MAG: 5-(carboxyamino)imidazole ribonucleotide synthase [Alphaproteobacteria bacterium]|nr:5-(carboxyamino)imidazole ribonucleotide synthase [Alphaproteobacteria bacterium]
MKVFAPGSTIGILGGGQLGRMTALAAAKLGYRCHIFCPGKNEPAVGVAAAHTCAGFDDRAALEAFAQSVDVATLEWENVPVEAPEIVGKHVPMYPGVEVLRMAQDREQEKTFARQAGVGTADFAIVRSEAELAEAMQRFSLPAILKSTRMGYDGKGQVKITSGMDAAQAWREMGSQVGILEAFIDFACEVSVIVAARADGETLAYPAIENVHRHHILDRTFAPARVDPSIADEAVQAAQLMARKLGVVGLLAVEFFVLRQPDGQGRRVLLNEIAPRPHNSGHWTMDACPTSQFEQLVRAVCGLPLGDVTPHSRAEMLNLIGEDANRWEEFLKMPQTSLHLYGKDDIRPGRKMGHVNFLKGAWNGKE